jgi:hypothetical protein
MLFFFGGLFYCDFLRCLPSPSVYSVTIDGFRPHTFIINIILFCDSTKWSISE